MMAQRGSEKLSLKMDTAPQKRLRSHFQGEFCHCPSKSQGRLTGRINFLQVFVLPPPNDKSLRFFFIWRFLLIQSLTIGGERTGE